MFIDSVLVEIYENNKLFTTSAFLFNKRWVILPYSSLIIDRSKNESPQLSAQILQELQNLEPSKLNYKNYLNIHPDNTKVITKSKFGNELKYFLAKYVAVFSCKNIKRTTDLPLACGDNSGSDLDYNNYLSGFLILDINMDEDFFEQHFLDAVKKLLKFSSTGPVYRSGVVSIESSAFGCRELLGSFSEGIICNLLGEENCFILIDAPTSPGAEGAPIFVYQNENRKSNKIPIGLVLSSLNWWRGEHTGLTLGVQLGPLLRQLLPQKWSISQVLFSNKNSVMNTIDTSIVQVFCGNGWGTAVLIDKNLGTFITGSHVVKDGRNAPINLKWGSKKFPCELVFRTELSTVFDVAVLRCSAKYVNKMSPLKLALKPALKGEVVLAAGYPIFNPDDFIYPVVTRGHISLTDSCIIHTTCCVLSGSSGGAIVRTNGELLGIIVCHTTLSTKNDLVVFPKINMAVPISAISGPILQYIKTNDTSVLQSLESHNDYILKKWQLFQAKL